MTIGVECPHCESQFQLDPKLSGQAIRCPNSDCREIFTVRPMTAAAPSVSMPAPASPPPAPAAPITRPTEPLPPAKTVPSIPIARNLAPTEAPPPAISLPAEAKKVVAWDENAELLEPLLPAAAPSARTQPAPKPATPSKRPLVEDDDDIPITRRKKSSLNGLILAGMLVSVVAILGVGVWFVVKKTILDEQQQAEAAQQLYTEGKFGEAKARYEELARDYPDSKDREKYGFFAELAGLHASVGSVTTRDNPTPALTAWSTFLKSHGESPFAKVDSGFAIDIGQAGSKLLDALAAHGEDRLKAFRANRSQQPELEKAKSTLTTGREVEGQWKRFQGKNSSGQNTWETRWVKLEQEIQTEETRLATLAPWRAMIAEPTDSQIDDFARAMRQAGLANDAEVQSLLATASTNLRKLVGFRREPVLAKAGLPTGPAYVWSTAAVAGDPLPPRAETAPKETVFALSHGVLTAVDGYTGEPLWTTRIAEGLARNRPLDLPTRYVPGDGTTDWVFLATQMREPTLQARQTRTGEGVWHLPLPHPAFGKPLLYAGSLFVPLADDLGTILQVRATTGEQLGKIELRQTVGANLSIIPGARRGSGLLVVPADARRIFFFEFGKESEDGQILPPELALVLATDHPEGSLRSEAVLVGADSIDRAPRLILTQADGPTQTRIRSFPLPKLKQILERSAVEEIAPTSVPEVMVPGWTWFAPVTDGERIALVTDNGQFAVYGINQPGSNDSALFALPTPKTLTKPDVVQRGQVVLQEDDGYWIINQGSLQLLRSGVDTTTGPRLVPQGNPQEVGEPLVPAQYHASIDFLYIMVRHKGLTHLIAFQKKNGRIAWKRQIGIPFSIPTISTGPRSLTAFDESGGVYAVSLPDKPLQQARLWQTTRSARSANPQETWIISAKSPGTGWQLLGDKPTGSTRFELRSFTPEHIGDAVPVQLPSAVAGTPVRLGESLLVPLVNGTLVRCTFKDGVLQTGPVWRGSSSQAESRCFLTSLNDEVFFSTNGENQITRWTWPKDQAAARRLGSVIELPQAVELPVQFFQDRDGNERVLAVDRSGLISLFDPARPLDPIRRWRGAAGSPLPSGLIQQTIIVDGTVVILLDRNVVARLDPEAEKPLWVEREPPSPSSGPSLGIERVGEQIVQSYASGECRVLALATGAMVARCRPSSTILRQPATWLPELRAFALPLADGSLEIQPAEILAELQPK